jgi:hypothetical protein
VRGDREFWTKQRGVTNAAYLQRFENFGRVYPRYRDMKYLQRVMVQWDIAIRELFQHDRWAPLRGCRSMCKGGVRSPGSRVA